MKRLNYRIRLSAAKDLEGIWKYTLENWSKEQADRYHNLIINEIQYVANNKAAGKNISHIKEGYYVTPVKSHQVYFIREDDMVHVIRILHQRMDIESNLR